MVILLDKELVGKITHYYGKIGVAIVELSATLKQGDRISIEKDPDSFEQVAESMQIENEPITEAKAGQAIGLKVEQPTKEGAQVFKITE